MKPTDINTSAIDNQPQTSTRWQDWLRPFAVVLPIAFILGLITALGQSLLPDWLSSLANSAGGWSLAVFGLVLFARCRPLISALLGLIGFLLLNVGYAVMAHFQGNYWSLGINNKFVLLSFVAGPLVGLAATFVRDKSVWCSAVAGAVLPAILIGEGVYGLRSLANSTSSVYWYISIVVGLLFILGVAALKLRSLLPVLCSLGLTFTGAAMFYVTYTII